MKNKVVLSVCSGSGLIPVSVVNSLMSIEGTGGYMLWDRQMIDQSRNSSLEFADTVDATHLMFIDDDQLFEPDIIAKLLKVDADIACAPVKSRMGKEQLNIFDDELKRIPIEDFSKTQEIYACGMGLTLIKMEKAKKIMKDFTYPFMFGAGEVGGEMKKISEDLMFCVRMQNLGGKIVAVKGIPTGHIGSSNVYWYGK